MKLKTETTITSHSKKQHDDDLDSNEIHSYKDTEEDDEEEEEEKHKEPSHTTPAITKSSSSSTTRLTIPVISEVAASEKASPVTFSATLISTVLTTTNEPQLSYNTLDSQEIANFVALQSLKIKFNRTL